MFGSSTCENFKRTLISKECQLTRDEMRIQSGETSVLECIHLDLVHTI